MKLVAYLRVSTDAQADHGFGLEVQREGVQRWARQNAHRIVTWTADEGVSGANGVETREALPDALEALQAGHAGGLVVYSLDRLARLLHVQEAILGQVWAAGAHVFSVADGGEVFEDDPDDPWRTAMRQMRGVFSQLDRAMITKRLRDGQRRKAALGGYAAGAPPFGWRAVNGALAQDADEQAVLARIRTMKADGLALAEIARRLNAENVRARRGRWHPTTVSRALTRA